MSLLATQPVYADGIHLPGTPIWLDPKRPQSISFVSNADRIAPLYYRKSLASAETAALVQAISRGERKFHPLTPPYGQGFTLGNIRAELLPSGLGMGASQLRLETEGFITLYSRDISLKGGTFFEGAAHTAAHRLILGTDGAIPSSETLTREERTARLTEQLRSLVDLGHSIVLKVPPVGVAQDVFSVLESAEISHRVGPIIHRVNKALNALRIPVGLPRTTGMAKSGEVLLWSASSCHEPVGEMDSILWLHANKGMDWRETPEGKVLRWTPLSTREELLDFTKRVSPDEVITVGEQKEEVALFLKGHGWKTSPLVTKPQLPLQI